jgi:hypothetical protein
VLKSDSDPKRYSTGLTSDVTARLTARHSALGLSRTSPNDNYYKTFALNLLGTYHVNARTAFHIRYDGHYE